MVTLLTTATCVAAPSSATVAPGRNPVPRIVTMAVRTVAPVLGEMAVTLSGPGSGGCGVGREGELLSQPILNPKSTSRLA